MVEGTLSYRQRGGRRADVEWGRGGETEKWHIMGWGIGGGGNWEVRYHLRYN